MAFNEAAGLSWLIWYVGIVFWPIMSMVMFWFGWFGKCSGCVQLLEVK
jgi:hypothetical protein